MNTPASIIYELAGRPDPPAKTQSYDGPCMICGWSCEGEGIAKKDCIADTFTDQWQAQAIESPFVCVPCAWSIKGKPPFTLRLWSWLYREDMPELHPESEKWPWDTRWIGILATNKADMTLFVKTLLDPPECRWFATIADSGQLHVVCFASVNHGSGQWKVRMDRENIDSSPNQLAELLLAVCELRQAGFLWSDIMEQPSSMRLSKIGVNVWKPYQKIITRMKDSPLLRLIRVCTKEENIELYRGWARDVSRGAARALGYRTDERHEKQHEHKAHQPDGLVGSTENSDGGSSSKRDLLGSDGEHYGRTTTDRSVWGRLEQLALFAE